MKNNHSRPYPNTPTRAERKHRTAERLTNAAGLAATALLFALMVLATIALS